MALIKCKECGKDVSDNAPACPSCGSKLKPKTKVLTWLVVGTMGVVLMAAIFSNSDKPTPNAGASKPPVPRVKTKEDLRLELAIEGAKEIKKLMRDPDSLKFESIGVNDDASTACYVYRAKNGFGGLTKEIMVFHNRKASQDAADFKKYCSQPLEDLTSIG